MNNAERLAVQKSIGYIFKDPDLLEAAFTHSSYVNEHDAAGNERVEFLGDCVLNFLVGERLFADKSADEGKLSARRAALVSRAPLARIIDGLGFIDYLRVGVGVDKTAFSEKKRSDLFEAILGAAYIDGGLDACRVILDNIFFGDVRSEYDYKSELQLYAVGEGLAVEYITEERNGRFCATVTVGESRYSGHGKTKHAAQVDAAKSALSALKR